VAHFGRKKKAILQRVILLDGWGWIEKFKLEIMGKSRNGGNERREGD